MPEPIFTPEYWGKRLRDAQLRRELWKSVFVCHEERWLAIEAKHREILARVVEPRWDVFDAGCGYGRLLNLMPPAWEGSYLGCDVSRDMVDLARERHTKTLSLEGKSPLFITHDLRERNELIDDGEYDLAVMISVRPMVVRNMGQGEWAKMEAEIKRVAKRLLYLEYDPADEGELV